jgi:carboxynorspermidine decarboxylase
MNLDHFDPHSVPSPCFVVDEVGVERNLQIIDRVQKESGAKVLLALKGFAMWSMFPLIRRYLPGCCASGLNEALLAKEEFGGEIHVHGPAFPDREIEQLIDIADHISFNSFDQWQRAKPKIEGSNTRVGIRINPMLCEVQTAIYDPCAPGSRLGVTIDEFERYAGELDGITGLHFHTLCELNADSLERTLAAVEEQFGTHLADPRITWVNFGGGHHISRDDYDVELLIQLAIRFRERYGVEVILEPGEAIALNAGVLVGSVLDVVHNEMDIAILDVSATAHMPDVLEMPYRPDIVGQLAGSDPHEQKHTFRLGGLTCLAGDVIGDYSFDRPLKVGDHLVFDDMAHYTMVKTTMFNGVALPSIAIHNSESGETRVVREFGYEDYRNRLS